MASKRGKATRFNRYRNRRRAQEARRELRARKEHERQLFSEEDSHADSPDQSLQEFLVECLLAAKKMGASRFGILWHPRIDWAPGPSHEPHAEVFKPFVEGHWNVSMVSDIDGNGTPGWWFTRTS